MRILQALILAALVVIAGLLFSIGRKMSAPEPAPAVAQAPVAAPAASVPPARSAPSVTRQPARPPWRAPAAGTRSSAAPQYESISRPASPQPEYASAAPTYTPPAAPPARSITVPTGTAIAVRLLDGISSERNRAGDTFQATLDEPVVVDGVVVAHRGANVVGRVVQAKESGRVAGLAEMALELDRITTVGGEVQIASDTMMRQAETSKGKDAATVGAMAGIGAAIGAIAGGRKGAGIGAAAGGTAGAGTVMATKGKPVKFDPETRLTFRLRAPITITADNSRFQNMGDDADRPHLYRRN